MKHVIIALSAIVSCLHLSNSLVVVKQTNHARVKRWVEWGPRFPRTQNAAPEVVAFHVVSDIRYRYATTKISSNVVNRDMFKGTEVVFSAVLPDTAFVSKFVMIIDGSMYEAYVKEMEVARTLYLRAKSDGASAGLIEKRAKHSDIFTISVHVASDSNVTFHLTYEELLKRKFGRYEHAINVNPEKLHLIPDYSIKVNIIDSSNLSFVHVVNNGNANLSCVNVDSVCNDAAIRRTSGSTASISWTSCSNPGCNKTPNQQQAPSSLPYRVYYDIERGVNDSEMLFGDGYFAHFFAPDHIPPLRKHVVFVLDISGSMYGISIQQLKQAMNTIMYDMTEDDYFNIVTFNSAVHVMNQQIVSTGNSLNLPISTSEDNILASQAFIESLKARGGTNIHGALLTALNITTGVKPSTVCNSLPVNTQSMIIFLTDGEPTAGVLVDPDQIISAVDQANIHKVPIYSLAFGNHPDFNFLKRLSQRNNGFARKIYALSDAPLQLQGFYAELSSPKLANANFSYAAGTSELSNITRAIFPVIYSGTELAVAGKIHSKQNFPTKPVVGDDTDLVFNDTIPTGCIDLNMIGKGRQGALEKHLQVCNVTVVTSRNQTETNVLERLWAYLTIQQLIEDMSTMDSLSQFLEKAVLRSEATTLAKHYGFVTSLTSLVVLQPNCTQSYSLSDTELVYCGKIAEDKRRWTIEQKRLQEQTETTTQNTDYSLVDYSLTDDGFPDFDAEYSTPPKSDITQISANIEPLDPVEDINIGSSFRYIYSSSTTTTTTTTTTEPPRISNYTLGDISWMRHNQRQIYIARRRYTIGRKKAGNDNEGYACTAESKTGQCRHLRTCILEEFISDETRFKDNYFCAIDSRLKVSYVGTCCVHSK